MSSKISVVFDTDALSALFKRQRRSLLARSILRQATVWISFQTLAELIAWQEIHGWGSSKRENLKHFLLQFDILESNSELAACWASVRAEGHKRGRQVPATDAWIAATALYLDAPLLTHNRNHFEQISGLRLLPEAAPDSPEGTS